PPQAWVAEGVVVADELQHYDVGVEARDPQRHLIAVAVLGIIEQTESGCGRALHIEPMPLEERLSISVDKHVAGDRVAHEQDARPAQETARACSVRYAVLLAGAGLRRALRVGRLRYDARARRLVMALAATRARRDHGEQAGSERER